MRKLRAFTLLELIVTIVILAILAALAIPTFKAVISKSQNATTITSMTSVARDAQALRAFNPDSGWTDEPILKAAQETKVQASSGLYAAPSSLTASSTPGQPAKGELKYSTEGEVLGLAMRSPSGDICALAADYTSLIATSCVDPLVAGSDPAGSIAENPAEWGTPGNGGGEEEEETLVAAPSNFSASVVVDKVVLSWEEPATPFSAYVLTLNGDEITPPEVGTTTHEVPIPADPNSTFALSAVAGTVTSVPAVVNLELSPNSPASFASSVDGTTLTFTWQASLGATSYELFKDGVPLTLLEADAVSHEIQAPTGEVATYGIVAKNSKGSSAMVTTVVTIIPASPSNLQVSFPGSGNTATLSWSAPAGLGVTGYRTLINGGSSSNGGLSTTKTMNVTAGSSVTFSVFARGPAGESLPATITVQVPSLLTFSKVGASSGTDERALGQSVAASSTTMVVGAPNEDAVYVYTKSGSLWVSEYKLSSPTPGNDFGSSVAISGSSVIVGAPKDTTQGDNAGAAYVYTGSGSNWTLQQKLLPRANGETAVNAEFGNAVTISGEYAAVGAMRFNEAQVFNRASGVWSSQDIIQTYKAGTTFGYSLSMSGDTLVVGAPNHTNASDVTTGAAYVYKRSGALWPYTASLNPTGGSAQGKYGSSISLSGNNLAIGAPGENAAYALAFESNTWVQKARMVGSGLSAGDAFGSSVSHSGIGAIIIGAPGQDVAGQVDAGAVYRFTSSGATYTQNLRLVEPSAKEGNLFGTAVGALNSSTAFVVASPGHDGAKLNNGAIYGF